MSRPWLPLAAIGGSVVLWSAAYTISALVLESASPAVLSVGRFAFALVVLVPLAARRPGFRRTLLSRRTVVLGITGVTLYYSFANIGLLFTSPGTAALVAALLPVATAVAAVVMIGERLAPRTVVGLVLATVGVALVAASGLRFDLGVLLNAIAVTSYAVYTVLLRRDAQRGETTDALVLATATGVWGTLLMLPWLGWEAVSGTLELPTDPRGVLGILVLSLVVTAPTLVLFNYGAERLPAAISGVATAAIPALGYAIALLGGETPDPVKAVGGAIALVGVIVAALSQPDLEAGPPGAGVTDLGPPGPQAPPVADPGRRS